MTISEAKEISMACIEHERKRFATARKIFQVMEKEGFEIFYSEFQAGVYVKSAIDMTRAQAIIKKKLGETITYQRENRESGPVKKIYYAYDFLDFYLCYEGADD